MATRGNRKPARKPAKKAAPTELTSEMWVWVSDFSEHGEVIISDLRPLPDAASWEYIPEINAYRPKTGDVVWETHSDAETQEICSRAWKKLFKELPSTTPTKMKVTFQAIQPEEK